MIYSTYLTDSEDAKRNRETLFGCGTLPAYNAVLSVTFSDEATLEPVTLQEVKNWLRIDIDDEDYLVGALITAARIVCEQYAALSFIQRTVTAKIHNGLGNFTLPYGPVRGSITSYTDTDGLDVTDYDLKDSYGSDLTVVYDAGYDELPENLKTAVKSQVAYLYEQRGDEQKNGLLSEISKLILKQVRYV